VPRAVGVAVLLLGILMCAAGPAAAATITVNTTTTAPANDGQCGIYEAVTAANLNAAQDACSAGAKGADTIQFSLPTPAMLNIAAGGFGPLPVGPSTEPLTVKGPTANPADLTLDGAGSTRIFEASANLTLKNVTVTGAAVNGDGAGVHAGPGVKVTLTSTRFVGNQVFGDFPSGNGACVSAPAIAVGGSTFADNQAQSFGGCLSADDGGAVTINRSAFARNSAQHGGGAIWIGGLTNLDVSRTTFTDNGGVDGGAIFSNSGAGIVTGTPSSISESTFTGNGSFPPQATNGGALDFQFGAFTVSSSTFSHNFASADGGAIEAESQSGPSSLLATDDTFDGNTAFSHGSAIAQEVGSSSVKVTDSTVSRGAGPSSLWAGSGFPPFTLDRTIVAYPQGGLPCDGALITGDYNDVFPPGGTCPSGGTNLATDPLLSSLDNFGGPTQTELPGPGSPAVDAIPSSSCPSGSPPLDQRGVARPIAARCDIGAVEIDSRPDGQIAQSNGAFVGDNVYNSSGAGQTQTATVPRGSSIVFTVRPQNDAVLLPERLQVKGGGGNQYFTVRYNDKSGNDVTSAVTGSGFLTASLGPGGTERVRVHVTVLAGAPSGASISVPVNVLSTRVPARRDRVFAVVNAG
jgi:hypothetical protein